MSVRKVKGGYKVVIGGRQSKRTFSSRSAAEKQLEKQEAAIRTRKHTRRKR